jgi:hypothetical protein
MVFRKFDRAGLNKPKSNEGLINLDAEEAAQPKDLQLA